MIPLYCDSNTQEIQQPSLQDGFWRHKLIMYIIFVTIKFVSSDLDLSIVTLINISFLYATWMTTRNVLNINIQILLFALLMALFDCKGLQSVIISLNFFTFQFARTILKQFKLVLKKSKNLILTIIIMFYMFVYIFTCSYQTNTNVQKYFKNFGWTFVTLLQILTLDAWGKVGRDLQIGVPDNATDFGQVWIILFIFLMTYFYFNILIGLVCTSIVEQQNPQLNQNQPNHFKLTINNDKQLNYSFEDEMYLGRYYQLVIYTISSLNIYLSMYNQFQPFDKQYQIAICYLDDFIYTIHFIALLVLRGKIYNFERQSHLMMLLHFLSGPIAVSTQISGGQMLASFLNLLKIFTCPIIKGVFKGTFRLGNTLMAPLITLLSVTLLFSSLTHMLYYDIKGEYFSTLWRSFYTFIQVLTLDDWNAVILPVFQFKVVFPYILFPFYIFISNFILLNIMIALSCEYFIEIQMGMAERGPDNRTINKIQDLSKILKKIQMDRVYLECNNKDLSDSEKMLIQQMRDKQCINIQIKNDKKNCITEIAILPLPEIYI